MTSFAKQIYYYIMCGFQQVLTAPDSSFIFDCHCVFYANKVPGRERWSRAAIYSQYSTYFEHILRSPQREKQENKILPRLVYLLLMKSICILLTI